MSLFKTNQYQIITSVINRVADAIVAAQISDELHLNKQNEIWNMSHQIMESFVDELCIEFAKDNRLFNETIFRTQCGNSISNQHVIGGN